MVTTRTSQTNLELLKAKTIDMFNILGRDDFILTSYSQSPTFNQRGRINTQTTSTTSNITGDLQFSVKLIKPYIELGIAAQGNGIFYTLAKTSINANDEVTVDSVTWKLTSQVEGETLNDGAGSGSTVYQAWIAVRKPEV